MGWKSTKYITRQRAIEMIMSKLLVATSKQLEDAVESLGWGEEVGYEYGHNYIVTDCSICPECGRIAPDGHSYACSNAHEGP